MRKRRNLIVALILVATMVVGIGYAAISTTLTINGTTKSAINEDDLNENLNVIFTSAAPGETNVKYRETADGNLQNATAAQVGKAGFAEVVATYDVGLVEQGNPVPITQKGEYVTFVYTIENQSLDASAELTDIQLSRGALTGVEDVPLDTAAYFTRTVVIVAGASATGSASITDGGVVASNLVLEPGGTATVTVTVTLNKTLGLSEQDASINLTGETIQLVFSAEGDAAVQQPSGN